MKFRKITAAAIAGAGLGVAACAVSAPVSTSVPRPADWRAAASYIRDHPARRIAGMTAGILMVTTTSSYACLDGTCGTWSGTVVVSPGGRTIRVSSDDGFDDLAHFVFPGDYFYFPASLVQIEQPSDIRIITHAAVSLP